MSFDDAIRREHRNRDFNQDLRQAEQDRWKSAATSAREVIGEFLDLMAKAGNPGLRTFKQSRAKPGRDDSLMAFLPARRIQGWQVGNGRVITPDGWILTKFLDVDEVANAPSQEPGEAWQHGASIDGRPYGPYSADEVRRVLAPVLIDAGVRV